ncbi:MAG: hypothetical protein V1720_02485 [bacterium]
MKKNTIVKPISIIGFIICCLLLHSCSTTDPPPVTPPEEKPDTIVVNIVEESYKYIKINVQNTAHNNNSLIRLIRKQGESNFSIAQYTNTVRDTTILDDYGGKGLDYNTAYSYYAMRVEGEKTIDTSKTVTGRTREPINHNYIWEEITIGEWQSVLYDVWGTDENNVYAVGDITVNGENYGLLHYDGNNWIPTHGAGGNAIFGFGANDIWTVGGQVYQYDGNKWIPKAYLIEDNGDIKVLDNVLREHTPYHGTWGMSSSDLYFASQRGTIVHWNGQKATLMETPTKIFLTDIWGASESLILACGNTMVTPSTVLKYNGQYWRLMSELDLDTELYESVYVMSESEYYVSGSKTLRYYNNRWTEELKGAIGIIHKIRGDRNTGQVVAVGSAGTLWHFNGVDWCDFTNIAFKEYTTIYGIYVFEKTIFAVGTANSHAKISIGKLQ